MYIVYSRSVACLFLVSSAGRHADEEDGAVERRQQLQRQLGGHAHAHEALQAELRGDVADGGGPTEGLLTKLTFIHTRYVCLLMYTHNMYKHK